MGVTQERPLRHEAAGFVGVAPGTTHGAIAVWAALAGRANRSRKDGDLRGDQCGNHGVIPVVIRVPGSDHGPARRNEGSRTE